MLTKKTIKDVMIDINEYPHIPGNISLRQAIAILKNSMIEAKSCFQPMIALVIDDRGIIGTLRLRDILKGLEPNFLKPSSKFQGRAEDSSGLSLIWDSLFDKEAEELANKPVREAMEPITVFVDAEDPIAKAAYMMIHNDLLILPVLENKKKLVGLIRMIEVFDVLAGGVLDE